MLSILIHESGRMNGRQKVGAESLLINPFNHPPPYFDVSSLLPRFQVQAEDMLLFFHQSLPIQIRLPQNSTRPDSAQPYNNVSSETLTGK